MENLHKGIWCCDKPWTRPLSRLLSSLLKSPARYFFCRLQANRWLMWPSPTLSHQLCIVGAEVRVSSFLFVKKKKSLPYVCKRLIGQRLPVASGSAAKVQRGIEKGKIDLDESGRDWMEAREAGKSEIKGGQGSGGPPGWRGTERDREQREANVPKLQKDTLTHTLGNRDVSTDNQLQSKFGRKRGKKKRGGKREEHRLYWELSEGPGPRLQQPRLVNWQR